MENPRPEKVAVVDEVRARLESSDGALLTEYRGLKVGELAALRRPHVHRAAQRAQQDQGGRVVGTLDDVVQLHVPHRARWRPPANRALPPIRSPASTGGRPAR